ncbi:MAG: polyphosphate kinase 2 family protein [Chthoniobacterales bacterium]|nr:polyphosphate kinase 2 family protein [Chthoniobacterales bacterium]
MSKATFAVTPGRKVRLASIATKDRGDFSNKDEARAATETILTRLRELQERLYAAHHRALLVVLQGMDTSGKDGAIRKVFSGMNPQGCSVVSFKAPTPIELAHDFLWRIHHHTPPKGIICIFNRSHYESVLVERVHKLVPTKVWEERFDQINQFEALLESEGTSVVKFFLHISKNEQRERLTARLEDPAKYWKFNPGDVDERKLWSKYQEAYEDCLTRCSTKHAPWHIIPADNKWYRDWAISSVIVDELERIDPKFPPAPAGLEKIVIR